MSENQSETPEQGLISDEELPEDLQPTDPEDVDAPDDPLPEG